MRDSENLFLVIGRWWQNRQQSRDTHPRSAWLPTPGNVIFTLLVAGAIILTQNVWATPAQITSNNVAPSATTINYQGRLADDNGLPLTGNYAVEFAIYDAPTNGNLIWGTETHANVPVSDGLFDVGLGSLTSGGIPTNVWSGDRYLQVTVEGEPLTPRELIRSVPVAGMALTVPDGAITNVEVVEFGPNDSVITTQATTFEDIPGYEITMETTGGPILLNFQANIKREHNAYPVRTIFFDFAINGIRVSGDSLAGIDGLMSIDNRSQPASIDWIVTPPAGIHTFTVQWRGGNNEGYAELQNNYYRSQFSAIELKR